MHRIRHLARLASITLVLSALAIAGCSRTAPIYEVNSAPVVSLSGPLSDEEVRNAIIRAATDTGWVVTGDDPGQLQLQNNFRSHSATVNVDYTATDYDITYEDSNALRYNGTVIHQAYNNLVIALQKQINLRLNQGDHLSA